MAPIDPPPAGAPWDLPFEECAFAVLDCEMTGMDVSRDALLEVAVTRLVGGRVVDAYETLVRADVPSTEAAFAVHGIDPSQSAGAPAFAEVAPRLAALLDGAVPVAHGPELDQAFLGRAFAAASMGVALPHVIDTVVLARRAVHARTYALSALAEALSLGAHRWHRAGEDVRAVVKLFSHMARLYRPASARDLWEVRAGQRGRLVVRATLDAFFTRVAGTGRPVTVVARTPGHDAFTLVARVERWRSPHLLLAPVPRKGQPLRLLRADRVLHAHE